MTDARWKGVAVAIALFAAGTAIRVRRTVASVPPPTSKPATGLHFDDAAKRLGISFVYRDPLLSPRYYGNERLFFFGSGAAVADVDGDGDMDVFLPTPRAGERNHLYLNDVSRGGGLKEAAAEWGVADNVVPSAVTSATFFDYDNDGRPDLYLAGMGCTRLFHNVGGRFEDVSVPSGIRDCKNSVGAVALDFDGDGLLDLYVLRYWLATDYMNPDGAISWPDNYYDARNGGANTLYKNLGAGKFRDVTDETGGADTHWTLDAAWGDFTGTGGSDLYVANDFGADTFYAARGGKLVDVSSSALGMPDRRFGMGASLGDLDGSGRPAIFVTNEYVAGYDQTGNFLWQIGAKREATDQAQTRGVDVCGWAWGSLFGDLDLDGREDLYVANGFVTGNEGAPDTVDSYYKLLRRDYAFSAGTMMAAPGMLSTDFSKWPKIGTYSYAGNQADCLFVNRGDRFEDIAASAGLTARTDDRGVAAIDLEDDGALDLLVTTQNGPPHLYRNEIDARGRWIGLSLVGTASNRDGIGARVEMRQGARRWYRWATGGKTGFLAGSDPRLHFGIPDGGSVDVTVRWPSGRTDERHGLATGRYHVVREGAPE